MWEKLERRMQTIPDYRECTEFNNYVLNRASVHVVRLRYSSISSVFMTMRLGLPYRRPKLQEELNLSINLNVNEKRHDS